MELDAEKVRNSILDRCFKEGYWHAFQNARDAKIDLTAYLTLQDLYDDIFPDAGNETTDAYLRGRAQGNRELEKAELD